jgi:hypothetical protein
MVFPTFFLVFFIVWLAIIKLVMWFSGLTKLSRDFPLVETHLVSDEIKRWDYVSGTVNKTSLRNALTIAIHKNGLLISPNLIFRMGAGKALIPWSEVKFNGVTVEGCFEWTEFEAGEVKFHVFGNMEEIHNFIESSS